MLNAIAVFAGYPRKPRASKSRKATQMNCLSNSNNNNVLLQNISTTEITQTYMRGIFHRID